MAVKNISLHIKEDITQWVDCNTVATFNKVIPIKKLDLGSSCGGVGRAIASDTRDLWFKFIRYFIYYQLY